MLNTTTLALLAAAAALVISVLYWLARGKWQRERAADYHHFRCPNCQRRLRFLARQSGHRGECSNCGKAITFPPVSQSIE